MQGIAHTIRIAGRTRAITICTRCDERREIPSRHYLGVLHGLHTITECEHPEHGEPLPTRREKHANNKPHPGYNVRGDVRTA